MLRTLFIMAVLRVVSAAAVGVRRSAAGCAGLVGRDLQEDFLEAHAHRPQLQQAPAAVDDRPRDLAADVGAAVALDLERRRRPVRPPS